MFRMNIRPSQTRTHQLPQDIRKTNKRVSFSTGVIPTTRVSRPQTKSTHLKDKVIQNNSQVKTKEVEDHHRNCKFSNNKTSVTASNDSLNDKISNINFVCVTCGKCVFNANHDSCVLHYIYGVNSRTKKPMAMLISTREPKRTINQSVARPHWRTVPLESTLQKPKSIFKRLYEHVSKTCSWWYTKLTPLGYKWGPKSKTGNTDMNVSSPLGTESRTTNISEPKSVRGSNFSNTQLSSNSFVARMVLFGKDHFAPILGYEDLVQGNITIKRVYYVEGLNHNLFSVGSQGKYLYSITHQETTSPNLICLMDKASSSQSWLWHRRLSNLNFDTINLLSKNDIVNGLSKLKFIKDHLCFSCELGKAKYGENIDKMKEKGNVCIFVRYDTQSKGYRVYNKRTRLIVETIHVNFDELPQMASDHDNSGPTPQCKTMALEHNSLSPDPQSQDNVPIAYETNTTPSTSTIVVVDLTQLGIQTTPEPTTQALTVTTNENINQAKNVMVYKDKFINVFDTPINEEGETSSHHVDPSNMHTLYQRHPSEYHWTNDHPVEQVLGNPSQPVRTRRKLNTDGEMCMFTLTVSQAEPKNIKESMAVHAWIEAMQEELHQFERLDVWELVDRPYCKNVINMKWL
ncbi:retrovirus-related pol polyprotein from transposon TNT 1-94 [Tanacetum coccineum]